MPGASDLPGRSDRPQPADDARPDGQRGIPDRSGSRDRPATDSPTQLQERSRQLPDGHPSSPRHADGSRKPPVADLKDSELADRAGPPAESQAEQQSDKGSEGWRAALPRLQALWQRHTERWLAEQRSPVDRSQDEEGSWRGDGPRQYLNAEENLVTEHALDRVGKAEPEVSRTMKAVEAEVPGARLVGLENCLKGHDRFKEKVSEEIRAKPGRSIAQIGDYVPDGLRYTYQFNSDRYVDGYWDVYQRLQQSGYAVEFIRNSWDSTQYKGINTRWRTPAGQLHEVQFHTPESFSTKELTHDAYERIRSPATTSDLERAELHDFQSEATAQVPVPEGASAIPDYRKKET